MVHSQLPTIHEDQELVLPSVDTYCSSESDDVFKDKILCIMCRSEFNINTLSHSCNARNNPDNVTIVVSSIKPEEQHNTN